MRPALVGAVLVCGCGPDLVTDSGRLGVDVALHWPPGLSPHPDVPVVAGSQWCPSIGGYFSQPSDRQSFVEQDLDGCFAITVEGPATWDAGCAQLDGPGALHVTMAPSTCTVREISDVPNEVETLTVDVVDPIDVRGELHTNDDLLFESLLVPAPGTSFPTDWRSAPGETTRVAEGGTVHINPGLIASDGRRAAWSGGTITGIDAQGVATTEDSLDFEVEGAQGLRISPTLGLRGSIHALGVIETVPVDAAASIEVVAGYGLATGDQEPDGSTTWIERIVLRAVVRDRSHRPIWGMPIEWDVVEGHMSLQVDDEYVADYAIVSDVCVARPREPERRTAAVRARVGELSGVGVLEWTAAPAAPESESIDAEELELCEGPDRPNGCGCAADSRGAPWLAVVFALRRRRRTTCSTCAPGAAPSPTPCAARGTP